MGQLEGSPVSTLMSLDELRVAVNRRDLSLKDFHRALNALAENRDCDVPTVLSPTPIRFDIDHACFYWRAKHSPGSAYSDHRNVLKKRIIDRRNLKQKIASTVLAGLMLAVGAVMCYSTIQSTGEGAFLFSTVVLSLLCGLGFAQIGHIRASQRSGSGTRRGRPSCHRITLASAHRS